MMLLLLDAVVISSRVGEQNEIYCRVDYEPLDDERVLIPLIPTVVVPKMLLQNVNKHASLSVNYDPKGVIPLDLPQH